jgi:hypothetical protein
MPSLEPEAAPIAALEPVGRADRPLDDDDLLTQVEAARKRRRSVRTLERERAEGRGPPYVRDGGRILYRWGDIRKYNQGRVRGGDFPRAPVEPQPRRRSGHRKLPTAGATTP